MHNKHHATPNKINHDLDIHTLPLVAFNKSILKKGFYNKSWIQFQYLTFLPLSAGLVTYLFYTIYLNPRKVIRERLALEGLAMVNIHYLFYPFCHIRYLNLIVEMQLLCHFIRPLLLVLLSGYSWIACFAIHHLAMYLAFVYLFGHFSLSHTFRYLYIVSYKVGVLI
jgi:acyl-CoA 6-desaturase (Delta-6 desaturase)